ncbi:D(1)-like dopamine receptor [Stylophora pistillata]|uniref:D(1)-like dopamine receptor n=1 Tax=Stylophora pistillata TaxID=50429 RepID=UPI000C03976F|nr:D(1)-like dopamine receptor [Stylophora pistillata]XP_022779857.1 D(1)-like dopamine receptor [Stylophora pistillata]
MLLGFTCDEANSIQYHKSWKNHYNQVKQFDKKELFLRHFRNTKMVEVTLHFIILACMSILIVVANIIVCVSVIKNVRLRTYTNGFLVSLAVSDIFTGGLFFPVHLGGPHSPVAFTEDYLIAFVLLAGVGNICLVTWDRYVAVAKPFQYKETVRKYFTKMIIVIWATSLLVSLLPLAWKTNNNIIIHKVYLFCLMGFFVVIPYTAIFLAYFKIGQRLRKHQQKIRKHPKANGSPSYKRMKAEAKVAKIFLAIVIIFVLSWLPIIYMTTVVSLNRENLSPLALQKASLYTVALSSLANPLLYAFVKEDFRRQFKRRSARQGRGSVSTAVSKMREAACTEAACKTEKRPAKKQSFPSTFSPHRDKWV